jgi:hypothetical protein
MRTTLDTLNVLIGFAVVLLVISFAVTMITQIVVTVLNLRGWALRLKVTSLLVLIDNGIHPREAAMIAGLVLRNALIGKFGLPWLGQRVVADKGDREAPQPSWIELGYRPASVVQREELTRLLLAFGMEPSEYPDEWHWFGGRSLNTKALQATMRESLSRNGVPDPAKSLERLRDKMMKLEEKQPALSNSDRAAIAILEAVESEFIGKLNGWFDQTVERASDLFTGWTQLVAFGVAAVVAVCLQLDTVTLVEALARSPSSVNVMPQLQPCWPPHPWGGAANCRLPHVSAGIVLSTILLSFGGPFWYEMLKNLLKLRSSIAGIDDAQRKGRQTNQAQTSATG